MDECTNDSSSSSSIHSDDEIEVSVPAVPDVQAVPMPVPTLEGRRATSIGFIAAIHLSNPFDRMPHRQGE